MNPEIKRLLKLSSIPDFKLNAKEQALLDAWKNAQEPVAVKKPRKTRSKASKSRSKAPLTPKTINVSSEPENNEIVKVQNVITREDKVVNEES